MLNVLHSSDFCLLGSYPALYRKENRNGLLLMFTLPPAATPLAARLFPGAC
jgi:hypothetical protein